MDEKILGVGVVILLVGLFLVVAFWPLTAVSGDKLADDLDEGKYKSYDEGDKVTVYGTITDKSEFGNHLLIELDSDFTFLIEDKDSIDFSEGEDIYTEIYLKQEELLGNFEYWAMKGQLNNKRNLDYIFYAVLGGGAIISAAGLIKF